MYVTVHFVRDDGSEVAVETIFPGTPHKGDLCSFYDSDREEDLAGRVNFVEWRDVDGEILVHVHTMRP